MSLPDVVLDTTAANWSSRLVCEGRDEEEEEKKVRGATACSLDSGLESSRDGVSVDSCRDGLSEDSCSRDGEVTSEGCNRHESSGSSTPCSACSGDILRPESRSACSLASISSCDTDSQALQFEDEGEAEWDSLGRMGVLRRSSRFDKPRLVTVMLRREKGGFGLELDSQMPPVICSVFGEAESSGVRAGDRVLEVNGQSVRGLSHEDAGRILMEGPSEAVLLLHTQKPPSTPDGRVIYGGWLSKRGGSGMTPRNWRRRWFVVRDDCIAYYYASPSDCQPLGAIVLRNYTVSKASHDVKKPFAFKIMKGGARSYYFCADSEQEMNKWAQVMTEAAKLEGRESVHFSSTSHNVSLSALAIKDPDSHGWLYKQGNSIKTWRRRYCVLKAHQLFYYGKMSHRTAYGVVNLTNYQVLRGKSKGKKFYFSAAPKDKPDRQYNFYTETEAERDRWMQAIRRAATSTQ